MTLTQKELQEEEIEDFLFKSLQIEAKLDLNSPGETLAADGELPGYSSLLAVSNQYGFLVFGTKKGFGWIKTSKARTLLRNASKGALVKPPENEQDGVRYVECPLSGEKARTTHIQLSADQKTILLGTSTGQLLFYYSSVVAAASVAPENNLKPYKTVELQAEVLDIRPNPSEYPDQVAILTNDNKCRLCYIPKDKQDTSKQLGEASKRYTAMCWSKKGKQIVLGTAEGEIIQVTPENVVKNTIPPPESAKGRPVNSINWLTNTQWAVGYEAEDASQGLLFYIIEQDKQKNTTYYSFADGDICFPVFDRRPYYYTEYLSSFGDALSHFLVTLSSTSDECAVIGHYGGAWTKLRTPEIGEVRLPLSAQSQDTFCVGLGIDLTSNEELPGMTPDEPMIKPCPILYVLNNEGYLLAYDIVWGQAVKKGVKCADMVEKIETLPAPTEMEKEQSKASATTAPTMGTTMFKPPSTTVSTSVAAAPAATITPLFGASTKLQTSLFGTQPGKTEAPSSIFGSKQLQSLKNESQPTMFGKMSSSANLFGAPEKPSTSGPDKEDPTFGANLFGAPTKPTASEQGKEAPKSTFGANLFGAPTKSTTSEPGKETSKSAFGANLFGAPVEQPKEPEKTKPSSTSLTPAPTLVQTPTNPTEDKQREEKEKMEEKKNAKLREKYTEILEQSNADFEELKSVVEGLRSSLASLRSHPSDATSSNQDLTTLTKNTVIDVKSMAQIGVLQNAVNMICDQVDDVKKRSEEEVSAVMRMKSDIPSLTGKIAQAQNLIQVYKDPSYRRFVNIRGIGPEQSTIIHRIENKQSDVEYAFASLERNLKVLKAKVDDAINVQPGANSVGKNAMSFNHIRHRIEKTTDKCLKTSDKLDYLTNEVAKLGEFFGERRQKIFPAHLNQDMKDDEESEQENLDMYQRKRPGTYGLFDSSESEEDFSTVTPRRRDRQVLAYLNKMDAIKARLADEGRERSIVKDVVKPVAVPAPKVRPVRKPKPMFSEAERKVIKTMKIVKKVKKVVPPTEVGTPAPLIEKPPLVIEEEQVVDEEPSVDEDKLLTTGCLKGGAVQKPEEMAPVSTASKMNEIPQPKLPEITKSEPRPITTSQLKEVSEAKALPVHSSSIFGAFAKKEPAQSSPWASLAPAPSPFGNLNTITQKSTPFGTMPPPENSFATAVPQQGLLFAHKSKEPSKSQTESEREATSDAEDTSRLEQESDQESQEVSVEDSETAEPSQQESQAENEESDNEGLEARHDEEQSGTQGETEEEQKAETKSADVAQPLFSVVSGAKKESVQSSPFGFATTTTTPFAAATTTDSKKTFGFGVASIAASSAPTFSFGQAATPKEATKTEPEEETSVQEKSSAELESKTDEEPQLEPKIKELSVDESKVDEKPAKPEVEEPNQEEQNQENTTEESRIEESKAPLQEKEEENPAAVTEVTTAAGSSESQTAESKVEPVVTKEGAQVEQADEEMEVEKGDVDIDLNDMRIETAEATSNNTGLMSSPFGATNNTSSPFGGFGTQPTTTAPANSVFGAPSSGTPSKMSSQFGAFGTPTATTQAMTTTPASSGFVAPAFGSASVQTSSPFGAFGSPSATTQATNTAPMTSGFVAPAFGSPSPLGGGSPFGAKPASGFGQPAFGSSTPLGQAQPAFGQTSFGQPAFGQTSFGAPSFGSTAAGGFGSKPAFGQTSGFGSTTSSGFGAFASTGNTASFGAVAQQSGGMNSNTGGFGGFAATAPSSNTSNDASNIFGSGNSSAPRFSGSAFQGFRG